ncbi:hypothetical protein BDF22DRAFT_663541 [Syncephalis plumigaleata]|nr:hypothetical protein BDF22DRAFT_663541 [Syncephalis plumigaleata]
MTSSSSPSTTSTTTTTTSIDTLEHRATVSVKGQSPPLKTPVLHIPPQRVQSLPSAIRMNNPLLGSAHSPVAPLVKEPLPELPLSPRLRRNQLQRWIIGFSMELVYPSLGLDADLKQNISFCAFPDSHAVSLGDTVYSFRVRVDLTSTTSTTSGLGTTPLARCHSSGPAKPKLSLPDITDHDGFLYGYVLFRQRKDPHLRRGYFQKSLVLLSKQHLPGLYLEIVRRVGANYFTEGRHVLEHACVDIANWPKPSPGKTLLLPLLDAKLQVELPSRHRMQLLPRAAALNNPDQYLLASIAPAALYTHSREFLNDLWLCWELVLLGEPIMVLAKGTRECADTVLSLINLIAPIPYGGDWRPYFTVHDSDFKAYSSRLKTPGSVIVGVTNPFFKDAFDHWPNILRVNQADTTVPTRTPSPFERPSLKKFGRQGSGSSFDFIPGLTSKRKRTIDRDTALIKEITTLAQQRVSPHLLNDTIRKYFSIAELTTSQSPPSLKPFRTRLKFKTAAFQATACSDFYAQFLRCPNFVQWLQMRSVAAERRLRQTHLQVELVDMLMRIRYHLRTAVPIDQRPSDEQMDQLRAQAELIVNRLPADLKTMLTPAAPIC